MLPVCDVGFGSIVAAETFNAVRRCTSVFTLFEFANGNTPLASMDAALSMCAVADTVLNANVVPSRVGSGVIVTVTVVPAVVMPFTVQSTLAPLIAQLPPVDPERE